MQDAGKTQKHSTGRCKAGKNTGLPQKNSFFLRKNGRPVFSGFFSRPFFLDLPNKM
jgi:hypothetical protein